MPQLEEPTAKIYNYVLGGIWGEKSRKKNKEEEDWQQLFAQVLIFKKNWFAFKKKKMFML